MPDVNIQDGVKICLRYNEPNKIIQREHHMKLILTDHINNNTNLSVRIHLSEIGRFHVAIIVTCSRLLEQHACRLTCSAVG